MDSFRPPEKIQSAERPAKRRFARDYSGPSVVQRHFRDQQNVNNIVARYKQTGLDPYADRIGNQRFGFATSKSFTEAMQQVAAVQSAFATLPSAVRAEYENDPAQWLDSQGQDQGSDEIVPPEALQEAVPEAGPPKITEGG